jgi:hypothetical protein
MLEELKPDIAKLSPYPAGHVAGSMPPDYSPMAIYLSLHPGYATCLKGKSGAFKDL